MDATHFPSPYLPANHAIALNQSPKVSRETAESLSSLTLVFQQATKYPTTTLHGPECKVKRTPCENMGNTSTELGNAETLSQRAAFSDTSPDTTDRKLKRRDRLLLFLESTFQKIENLQQGAINSQYKFITNATKDERLELYWELQPISYVTCKVCSKQLANREGYISNSKTHQFLPINTVMMHQVSEHQVYWKEVKVIEEILDLKKRPHKAWK